MDRSVPAAAAAILNFVGDIEAPAGYNTIFANKQNTLAKPLTKMTLGEVIENQSDWSKRHGSSAAGRYQFMRKTLIDLKSELGLSLNQRFDANFQDRLGFHLLKRRGYDLYMTDRISRTEFGKRLAQEWASLPVLAKVMGQHRQVQRGESYYAGDKLNKSLISPEHVERVLDLAKQSSTGRVPRSNVKKKRSLWAILVAALGGGSAAAANSTSADTGQVIIGLLFVAAVAAIVFVIIKKRKKK